VVMQQPALCAKKANHLKQNGCYQNHHHDQVCRLHRHVRMKKLALLQSEAESGMGASSGQGRTKMQF
jgi:hypothetical protein